MGHNKKVATRQVGLVLRQHGVEMFGSRCEIRLGQPQENYAGVIEALLKYQLSKVQQLHKIASSTALDLHGKVEGGYQ
ncbi:MAG: hypothetical protein MUD06_03955 [Rhodospirillales bacterium]|nr:hypothetical protein [Rhodospirillales bacterium]